ncbi:MAG: hypothetical protein JST80_08920 [Bdellovibrionales bacterium]|nr:hypothetical protein [Bdellovibrionales bacterium]
MTLTKTRFKIVILAMFALSSCTQDEHRLWIQVQNAKKETASSRKPAQNRPQCFSDRYRQDLIAADIVDFEKDYYAKYKDQKPSTFQFGDQNFSSLHPLTIAFLSHKRNLDKTYGSSWIATSPAQAACNGSDKTGNCFVEALYGGNGAGVDEGLMHYWFFLKTGYVMSAQKVYPWFKSPIIIDVSPKDVPLQNYLFDANEWRAWWKMANLLPASMIQMPSLQTIHRLPRGAPPDEWKGTLTCGLSTGRWNAGFITLGEGCLTVNKRAPLDQKASYFYSATTHEFAHRLAAWNFSKDKNGPEVSLAESPEFMALSGWKKEELVEKTTGKISMVWKNNENGEYVTSYSRTSPAEDFAESVGYFRMKPEWVQEKSPLKYRYIREKVYGKQGYTATELNETYTRMISDDVIESIDTWLTPCTGVTPESPALDNAAYSKIPGTIQITVPIDKSATSCIQVKVTNRIAKSVADIRYDEPEGCEVMNKSEADIVQGVAKTIGYKLDPYLKNDAKVTDMMKNVTEFRKAMTEEFDARTLVLACWRQDSPQACYDSKLETRYKELYEKNKALITAGTEDVAEIEHSRFKRNFSYEVQMGKVSEFYENLMFAETAKIPGLVDRIWNDCKSKAGPITATKLSPYTPGAAYMPPEMLNCVNRSLEDDQFVQLRTSAGADRDPAITIVAADAREWIDQRVLLPRFKAALDQKLAEASKADQDRLAGMKAPQADRIASAMTKDWSWQPDGQYFSYVNCRAEAGKRLNGVFTPSDYRFVSLGAELDGLGNQICEKVRVYVNANANKPGPGKPRTEARAPADAPAMVVEQTPEALWKKLSPALVAQAQGRFNHCRNKVYFARKLRRFCLFTEPVVDDQDQYRKNAWSWTRDRGVHAWMKDPEVQKYYTSKGYSESAFFDAVQARVDEESQEFVDAINAAFFDENSDQ